MAASETAYADLLDSLSPLTKAGIDPDDARMDRAGTMEKLMGPAPEAPWYEAQNDAPPRPGTSPNGNALPPGINSRVQAPPPTPDAADAPAAAAALAVPPSVTPAGAPSSQPSLATNNAATIARMQGDYNKASSDVQAEADSPDLADVSHNLEQQRQNQAQPLPAYDPQTGKLLDEYKPSIGQRLARGLEGYARAGILGAIDPKIGGGEAYGAPNSTYQREVQQRAGNVASLDQQLKQAKDNYTEKTKRRQQVVKDRTALATAGKDVTAASQAQQDQPDKDMDAQSRSTEANNNSPQAKQQVAKNAYTALNSKADDLGLKGQQRTLFLANGKLPDPRQATADEIARSQATAAWHRDNPGKQPTLDDIRSINAAVLGSETKGVGGGKSIPPATAARISDKKNAAMKTAQDKINNIGADGRLINPKYQDATYNQTSFVNDMNEAQSAYEEGIEAAGGTVNHMTMDDDMRWSASGGESSNKKPSATAASGDDEGAKDGEIAVVAPDGTPGYIPASQLQKALRKGYTQPKKGK